MAWSSSSTRSTGDLITAAIWNQDVVANVSYLHARDMCARVYNSADLEIANNTITTLTFDSEYFDTDAIHSVVANTNRLTAQTAGTYIITASISWEADGGATGERILQIKKNGTDRITVQREPTVATNECEQSATTIDKLVATDYVEVLVFQNSGGALDVDFVDESSAIFAMALIAED